MLELFEIVGSLGEGNFLRGISIAFIPICACYVWLSGLMGLIFQNKILITYGAVVRPLFEMLRMAQALLTPIAIYYVIHIATYTAEGFDTNILISDVLLLLGIVGINVYLLCMDNLRFRGHCDKKVAKKIRVSERRLGCSILTYLSLLFFVVWFTTVRLSLAKSIYVEDECGNIYIINNDD